MIVCRPLPGAWLDRDKPAQRLPHTTLTWIPTQPDLVVMHICGHTWTFELAIIEAGIHGPAGEGAVFACRVGQHVEIVLDNGTHRGALAVDLLDLDDFLRDVDQQRAHSSGAAS